MKTLHGWRVVPVRSWKTVWQAVVVAYGHSRPVERKVWSCEYGSQDLAQFAARAVCARLNGDTAQ